MVAFSVVMPVYNVKRYLHKAIDSVLQQEYRDFELIIIDDGSTDGCYEICERYALLDKRIQVIHQENKGLLAARRAGIEASKGKYIVHIDSDDSCSNKLLSSLQEIIDIGEPDILIYNYNKVDENDVVQKPIILFNRDEGEISKEDVLSAFVSSTYLNAMWIKCAKRDVIINTEDYRVYGKFNMAEDELQSAAIYEKASTFYYIPKQLYNYRNNSASITKVFNKQNAINSMLSKKRKMLTVRSNEHLEQLFFRKYVRNLMAYTLDAAVHLQTKEQFFEFRKELHSVEIELPKEIKLPFIERMMLTLLHMSGYNQIKLVGRLYYVVAKWIDEAS